MKSKVIPVLIYTLIASLLPTVILREWLGKTTYWVPSVQIVILNSASIIYFKTQLDLSKYAAVLTAIVVLQILAGRIQEMSWWQEIFFVNTFTGDFGGSILLKFIFALPLIALLVYFYNSPKEVYLAKGTYPSKPKGYGGLG